MSAFRYEEQLPNSIYGHTKYVIRADGGAEEPVAVCYDERTAEIICAALATGANPVAETGALGEPDLMRDDEMVEAFMAQMETYSGNKRGYQDMMIVDRDDVHEAMRKLGMLPSQANRRAPSGEPEGWRPISEAPRDGTYILACWWGAEDPMDRDYEPSVVAYFGPVRGGWQDSYGADYNEPTLWMPLPTPPRAPQEGTKDV